MQERSRRDIETLIAGGAFQEWWDDVGLARDREASMASKIEALEEEIAMHDQVADGLSHDAEQLVQEVGDLEAEAAKREVERTTAERASEGAQAAFDSAKQSASDALRRRDRATAGRERRATDDEYRRAVDAKDFACNGVEAARERMTRLAIQIGELRVVARRKKGTAEKLLVDTRLVRTAARQRRADVVRMINALEVARHATRKLLHEAAHRFDALVVSEYLYWSDSSNAAQLLCVPACSQVERAQLHVITAVDGIQTIEHILSAPKPDLAPALVAANS